MPRAAHRLGPILAVLVFVAGGGWLLGCSSVPPLPPKAVALNDEGARALARGDLTSASARLSLALEYSPRFVEAYVNLGLVELRRGNLDLARKHFYKARDLNPDLPAPHHALGLLADRRGLPAEAEKHYRLSLKVDPGFAASRANLGRILYARGAFDDARQQFLALTEVQPEEIMGWTGLVESLFRLERDGEADEALLAARLRFRDAPELALLVGRQLLRRGAYANAEDVLAAVTADADGTRAGAAWAWIAVARLGAGHPREARSAADEALLRDKSNAVALHVRTTAR